MQAFARLFAELDATTSSKAKRAAMVAYFRSAPPEDAAWAVYFLAGGKPRQLVPTRVLRDVALRLSGLPEWLFDECYHAVGDLAETIAYLTGPPGDEAVRVASGAAGPPEQPGLARWLEDRLLPLRGQAPDVVVSELGAILPALDPTARFLCGKLITGALRVGVSRLLVTRALGEVAGVEPRVVAERLFGYTDLNARPDAARYLALVAPESASDGAEPRGIQPYPFFLAQSLSEPAPTLAERFGSPVDWLVEWKYDGIRAQVLRRGAEVAVWSRGEELVTDRFPELATMATRLPPGTVVDGEILVWRDGRVQPFALLQQRLGRKRLSAALLARLPLALVAYDLLEWQEEDWRGRPLARRRSVLEELVAAMQAGEADAGRCALQLSPLVTAADWTTLDTRRQESRALGVEGMMLKPAASRYGVGRTRDDNSWWKWKVDPYSVDAVLVYAQRGSGKRASLYSDYTFAVWDGDDAGTRRLVPFAKAYSGLSDAELAEVDRIVRRTTVEKFGPVSSVTPTLVFELGFEGIARSSRHKSGIAVRFPRMLRWRRDKPVAEADTLRTLTALLPAEPPGIDPPAAGQR
ncbi:MAG: ATP-dependent DNA ligase [Burkholderiaceae bacterium]|nr:ATP-dependent DNA ligase [Burkholderiaceae bacterium]